MAWEIPAALRSDRFGVTHYHHPELVEALASLSPEEVLLAMIEDELFGGPVPGSWIGSAMELEHRLTGDGCRCAHKARKLFSWHNACGTYLSRLAKRLPERFIQEREENQRRWKIIPQR